MNFLRATLLGGFVAGAFDITYACVAYWLMRDVPPLRIFQSVASGVLGKDSFTGGAQSAVLGGVLHFTMATLMAGGFVLAARVVPALLRRPVLFGLLYGVGLFFLMNYVVVPLSAIHGKPPPQPFYAMGIAIHAFGVGLPIALIASRFGKPAAAA